MFQRITTGLMILTALTGCLVVDRRPPLDEPVDPSWTWEAEAKATADDLHFSRPESGHTSFAVSTKVTHTF